jgi:mono/diheme cytochrome c family protein
VRHQKAFIAAAALAAFIAIPVHAADPVRGKMLYQNTNGAPLSCGTAGCHGPDPNTDTNNIKKGANAPNVILSAINGGVGAMAFLATYVTPTDAADIAAYIANPAAGTPSPAATLSTATLSFGSQVVQTTSGTMSANLTNTGSANLVLSAVTLGGTNPTEFTRSGTCAAAVSLAPNGSCSINVTFKPTVIGARSATVTIGHNASPNTSVLSLTGTGAAAPTPAIGLSATTLAFGNQTLGTTSAPKTVSISNTGNANLVLGTITATGANAADFARSGCAGTTLTPGANCSVSVTFTPAALNARSATLSIASNASGSPHGVALSGNGVAAPTPAVTLNPTSLAFGNQTVGTTSAAKPIALTNSGSAALGISSIATTGSGFASTHNCGASLAAGASCTINVTFAPTSAAGSTGAVTIASAAAGSPHTVGLSGTGTAPTPTAPVATLAPTAVDFGMVTLNTPSATRALSLTNTGNAPLNLSAVNVTGANAGEFSQTSNCPVGGALAAGANCTISARFTPAATGARAASLTLTSNATGSPTVSLTGTGIVQASALAQVSPTQAKFGRVRLGTTSSDRTVRVRNVGTAPVLISSVSIKGEFVHQSGCTAPLAAGTTCEISVRFKPTVAGTGLGELAVASNATGAPHVVKLIGTGVTRANRERGERGERGERNEREDGRENERDDDDDDEDECDDEDKCSQAILPFSTRRRE